MKLNILVLLATLSRAYGYHILCAFPVPSHSHNQLGKGIVDAMLNAGHTVTWISPFPEKAGKNPPKTLKIIDVSVVKKYVAGVDMTNPKNAKGGIAFVKQFANNVTTGMLEVPAVKEALIKTQFDAVVTEAFFCDILAGIAAVQQAPWIVLSGVPMYPPLEAQVDEVRSVGTVPMMFNDCSPPMTFLNRAVNVLMYAAMSIGNWLDRPSTISLYESIFGPLAAARGVTLPPFDDAFHNVSIMLVNGHESLNPTFSTPPNVVNIAGYHIDENPPPLPKDLQELLDKSPQGVIYFSMGSVVRSAALKEHTRAALLRMFAALPHTVLWKFEEPLENLPPNVHVRPWMPQPSILAHPNVRLFITHGGQLSTLEAVRVGVPLLAVPVFGDQPSNAERARRDGYALRVDFHPDMTPKLEVALHEMLKNDTYSKRVKYLSKLFRARPVSPTKLIQHYIELAIETKGAFHLRSLSLQYKWYERWMLDLGLAFLLVLTALAAIVTFVVKSCFRSVTGKSKPVKFSKKKKN